MDFKENGEGCWAIFQVEGVSETKEVTTVNVEKFLDKLEGVHAYKDAWRAKCPAHNGKSNDSLSIKQGGNGTILIHCWGGCKNEDVVSSIGLKLKDLYSNNSSPVCLPKTLPPHKRPIEKIYNYPDDAGKTVFQVVKFKDGLKPRFLQRKSEKVWNIKGIKTMLYRLPEVRQAREVCICEGEKDADNLSALGFCGTTNPMGAGNWNDSYTETLRGKDLFIFQDNDVPGREHGDKVARKVSEVANSVRVVELPGLKLGQDVSDYIATFNDHELAAESLARLMENAPSWNPLMANPLKVQNVDDLLEEVLPDSWQVEGLISAEESGFIAGGSKTGKSIFAQNMAMSMAAGHKFLNTFNIPRPLKILYLNFEISKKNFQRRFKRMKEHAPFTYPRENLIHITQKGLKLDTEKNFKYLEQHVAYHKPDVVIVDCLYMTVKMSLDKHDTTTPFLDNISKLIETYKCSVIIIHHYRKPSAERRNAYGAGEMLGSFALHAYGDFYITFKQDHRMRNKLTLDFEMRNCEEPERMMVIRNPETLWYEFAGIKGEDDSKPGPKEKINHWNVVDTLKKYGNRMANPDLIAKLEKDFNASEKTVRNAISVANTEGLIKPEKPNARPVLWVVVGN